MTQGSCKTQWLPWLLWLSGLSAGLRNRHWFDSQSGHMPGLRARSPGRACERQPHTDVSLPPLKINKWNLKTQPPSITNDCTQKNHHPSCLFLLICQSCLRAFEKRARASACFSYFRVCYVNVIHTLGLFGCAKGKVAVTGDPKMLLVFPPGGFRRCGVCAGVDSSKIPLPFPPAKATTEQWAIRNTHLPCLPHSLLQRPPVTVTPRPVLSSGRTGWHGRCS